MTTSRILGLAAIAAVLVWAAWSVSEASYYQLDASLFGEAIALLAIGAWAIHVVRRVRGGAGIGQTLSATLALLGTVGVAVLALLWSSWRLLGPAAAIMSPAQHATAIAIAIGAAAVVGLGTWFVVGRVPGAREQALFAAVLFVAISTTLVSLSNYPLALRFEASRDQLEAAKLRVREGGTIGGPLEIGAFRVLRVETTEDSSVRFVLRESDWSTTSLVEGPYAPDAGEYGFVESLDPLRGLWWIWVEAD